MTDFNCEILFTDRKYHVWRYVAALSCISDYRLKAFPEAVLTIVKHIGSGECVSAEEV